MDAKPSILPGTNGRGLPPAARVRERPSERRAAEQGSKLAPLMSRMDSALLLLLTTGEGRLHLGISLPGRQRTNGDDADGHRRGSRAVFRRVEHANSEVVHACRAFTNRFKALENGAVH